MSFDFETPRALLASSFGSLSGSVEPSKPVWLFSYWEGLVSLGLLFSLASIPSSILLLLLSIKLLRLMTDCFPCCCCGLPAGCAGCCVGVWLAG